jgi:putative ABC transport system permease protein
MNKLFKKYLTALGIARGALKKNRVRTVLTILGVVIGIASVTVIISAGSSMKGVVYNMVNSFGPNFVNAETRVPKSSGGAMSQAQGVVITTMTEGDRAAILKLPFIDKAYSAVVAQKIISWQGESKKYMIMGTSPSFIDIDSTEVDQGRFFTEEEDKELARVVFIGSEIKNYLFGNNDAIGQDIKIDGQNFRVIGVAKPRGSMLFFNMDEIAYVPLKTTQKLLLGIDYVSQIVSQVKDLGHEDEAVETIKQILRQRHDITDPNKDDFEVMGAKETMSMMNTIIGGLTLLLVALAAVSLIVGGVGIMNIMYATVAERTFEIGLRKSIGASKKDIMSQFLMEAIFITFLGGVFGIILGLILTYLIYLVAQYNNFDWPFALSWSGIALSIGFSVAVGLIFGLYPAKRAADLDPITALRKE